MIKVLVVEDENVAAQHISKCIEETSANYSVIGICRNRLEVLEAFDRSTPDIIFTDIRLGKDDGLSIADELRKKGWKGFLVIMSCYGNFSYAKRAIQVDVEDYLLKPVFPEDVREILKKIYEKQHGTEEDRILSEILPRDIDQLPNHIKKALEYIAAHYKEQFTLGEIAKYSCVSESHLSADFSKQTGYTLVCFINLFRVTASKKFLSDSDTSLSTISQSVGINDVVYYSKLFKRYVGISPGQYRKNECKS